MEAGVDGDVPSHTWPAANNVHDAVITLLSASPDEDITQIILQHKGIK